MLQRSLNLYDNDYSVMLICLILFISSLPAFVCECMFGLCHAWPSVVFLFDLSWAAFCTVHSFPRRNLFFFFKETEVQLSQGFRLCQSAGGRGRMAPITDDVKAVKATGSLPKMRLNGVERHKIIILLLVYSL